MQKQTFFINLGDGGGALIRVHDRNPNKTNSRALLLLLFLPLFSIKVAKGYKIHHSLSLVVAVSSSSSLPSFSAADPSSALESSSSYSVEPSSSPFSASGFSTFTPSG